VPGSPGTAEFYAAPWIDVWLVPAGAAVDAFPDDLDELAAQFFAWSGWPPRRSGTLHLRRESSESLAASPRASRVAERKLRKL
jgi:hypothetical protein